MKTLPALHHLSFCECQISDDAVASLFDNLGKDEFKALGELSFDRNSLTDKACTTLVTALNEAAMPNLTSLVFEHPDSFGDSATELLAQATSCRGIKRYSSLENLEEDDETSGEDDEDNTSDEASSGDGD